MVNYKILTPSTDMAVTLAEACIHLNLVVTVDEVDALPAGEKSLVITCIQAAQRYCESYTRRQLTVVEFLAYLDKWPKGIVQLQKSPVISVSEVKYFDVDGVEKTLDSKYFQADVISEPARIKFIDPPTVEDRLNAVSIKFKAGYANDAGEYDATKVPQNIKSAMLLIIGHLYEHREEGVVGVSNGSLEFGVERLLDLERVFVF